MTIPSNQLVNVVPSVLQAGGTGIQVIGLVLTTSTRVPIGTVASFPGDTEVSDFFGGASHEAAIAGVYFEGFTNSTQTPSAILFAQCPQTAAAAYLQSGNISGLTLAQLQAINGSLDIVVDGYARAAGSLNLSAASSQSSAASIIQTALNASLPSPGSVTGTISPSTVSFTGSIAGNVLTVTAASGTIVNGGTLSGSGVTSTVITGQISGTPGGIGNYAVSVAQVAASTSITETFGTLDVTVTSIVVAPGQTVTGAGVTAATVITQQLSGTTGGIGNYAVNISQTVGSESLTLEGTPVVVSYDSTSGSFFITSGVVGAPSSIAFATGTTAASLLMTQATGAILSQGAAVQTPAAFMNSLILVNNDWVTFMTAFDPDGGSGNAQKQLFAAWKNTQSNRFAYVCWDTDITPTESVPASASLGQILMNNGDSGTSLNWEPSDQLLAAFVCGAAASINFNQTGGRITFAFKNQAGLTAGVTSPTVADNLAGNPQSGGPPTANGYNFYGAYATAGQTNIWYQRGTVTGPFLWFDSYINQIWLNNQFQIALLTFLGNTNSVPFNAAGAGKVRQACAGVIAAGLNFGAYAPGPLSAAQESAVNGFAGADIANTLETQGWYLQVAQASQAVRNARGPLQVNFFYLDQGSIQCISFSSVAVQP